jgi:hypothetical protein
VRTRATAHAIKRLRDRADPTISDGTARWFLETAASSSERRPHCVPGQTRTIIVLDGVRLLAVMDGNGAIVTVVSSRRRKYSEPLSVSVGERLRAAKK